MVLYESENITVSFDATVPTIIWSSKSPSTSVEFRKSNEVSLDKFLELKKEYPKLNSRLLDSRNFGALSPEDMDWASKVMDQKLKSAGVNYHALIVPEDIFGQLTVDEYISTAEGGAIKNKMFKSVEEAKIWLKGNI